MPRNFIPHSEICRSDAYIFGAFNMRPRSSEEEDEVVDKYLVLVPGGALEKFFTEDRSLGCFIYRDSKDIITRTIAKYTNQGHKVTVKVEDLSSKLYHRVVRVSSFANANCTTRSAKGVLPTKLRDRGGYDQPRKTISTDKSFFSNGRLRSSQVSIAGRHDTYKHGPYKIYHRDGSIRTRSFYRKSPDKQHEHSHVDGILSEYTRKGVVRRITVVKGKRRGWESVYEGGVLSVSLNHVKGGTRDTFINYPNNMDVLCHKDKVFAHHLFIELAKDGKPDKAKFVSALMDKGNPEPLVNRAYEELREKYFGSGSDVTI